MKKLMIAACAVSLAAAAQAANVMWGIQEPDAEAKGGDYLYPADEGGTSGKIFLLLGTATKKAVDGGYTLDFSGVTSLVLSDVGWYDVGSDAYRWGSTPNYVSNAEITQPSADGSTGTQAYSLLLIDNENRDNFNTLEDLAKYTGDFYLYTADSYRGFDGSTGTEYSTMMTNGAVTSADWNVAVDVPEPTSGLLLLLGVAGLALKRKRA